jgi:hypothetical protein
MERLALARLVAGVLCRFARVTPTASAMIAGAMWSRFIHWIRRPGVRTPLLVAAGSRLAVFLVASLALQLLGPVDAPRFLLHGGQPHPSQMVDLFQRWDSYWFLNIARHGYRYQGVQEQIGDVVVTAEETNITPLPLYPLLIRAGTRLVADPSLAGLLIALLCYCAAVVLLYRRVAATDNDETARRAILYLSLYPTGFIYNSIYSESLFLLLVLLCLHAAEHGRALRAGLSGAAASLTRLSGATLALCVFVELALGAERERRPRGVALGVAAAAMISAGWLGYFAYLRRLTGRFWIYFDAQQGWHKELVFPWTALGRAILGEGSPDQHLLNIAAVALFLPLCVLAARRVRWGETIYLWLGVLVPLCSSYLLGLPRYLMVLFPAFVLLARWGRALAVHIAILVGFCLVHGMVLTAWLRWQYSL